MDTAKVILDYIEALKWPITLFGFLLLFRNAVSDLLSRIKKAELPGGITLDISEQLEEAQRLSKEVKEEEKIKIKTETRPLIPLTEANARMLELGLAPSASGLDLIYYKELAKQDPNVALAGLRIETETMLKNLAKGFKIPIGRSSSALSIAKELKKNAAITSQQFELLRIVLELCNKAVHGEKVNTKQAEQILDIATHLVDQYVSWLSWGFPDSSQSKSVEEKQNP